MKNEALEELYKKALTSPKGGNYGINSARNILKGYAPMNDLKKALDMEKNFNISPKVWLSLQKKEN